MEKQPQEYPIPFKLIHELLNDDIVVNSIASAIMGAVEEAVSNNAVYLFPKIPALLELIYGLARHEQYLKEIRFISGHITPEDQKESIF